MSSLNHLGNNAWCNEMLRDAVWFMVHDISWNFNDLMVCVGYFLFWRDTAWCVTHCISRRFAPFKNCNCKLFINVSIATEKKTNLP